LGFATRPKWPGHPRPKAKSNAFTTSHEERIAYLEREVEELTAKVHAPAFYHGIPSSEVIRALDELGFGGLATIDGPQP
jgi:hypothetical protein